MVRQTRKCQKSTAGFSVEGLTKVPTSTNVQKEKGNKAITREEIICILNQIKEDVSKLQQNLPLVLNYLSHSCKVFKAGQVANYLIAWSNITKDREILAYVQRVAIELTEVPDQSTVPISNFQPHELHIVEEAISQLIQKGVVRKVPRIEGKYVSKIFLRPKADGSQRLILNLKKFNESVVYKHFKMDSIQTITKLIEKDCYMAALDLKDAYYSIPVRKYDQKFLQFEWNSTRYQFTCLPNGLSSAPRIFTKILKPVLATLHTMGHISTAHIDDCYLQGKTCSQCLENVMDSIILLDSLGFVVHPTKSTLVPTQEIVTLGFQINSVKMTIRLTADKAISLKKDCKTLLMSDKPTLIREVARVIGKIVASFPGVMYGPLYYRYLEGDKSQVLRKEKGNFDAYMVLSTQARSELQWWVGNVEVAYQTLAREAPKETIFTDASLSGWGAEFQGTSGGSGQ